MSWGVPMLIGYDAYGNAREWREMMRLEKIGHSAVRNKVIKGMKYNEVSCCSCGSKRTTLRKMGSGYYCRDCLNALEVSE